MKVCFISGEYPPMQGGVADYTERLAETLSDLGVDSCILTSTKARLREDLPVPHNYDSVFASIERWDYSSWPKVEGIIRQTSPDLVHIQYQTAAYGLHPAINLLPFWLHWRLPRLPVITTFHDLRVPYLFPKAGKLRQWANSALLKGSDGVVLTSEEDFGTVVKMGQPTAKLHLIPIGSNIIPALPENYDRESWRARYNIESGDILLSYFGLLNSSKGLETLLAALRRLLESMPRTKLLMVGASTGDSDPTNVTYQQQILKLINDWELGNTVIFTGYVAPSDVSANLMASDICVLPFGDGASFRRGSLMAALAHGLPIATTKVPGVSPIPSDNVLSRLPRLIHGENCVLVPPEDEQALAEAIKRLVDSPSLRTRLSEGALQLAKCFSWERIAQETVEMYHSLLSRRIPC
jgi:glycosyltransferase involved in cell wall biosynthesis